MLDALMIYSYLAISIVISYYSFRVDKEAKMKAGQERQEMHECSCDETMKVFFDTCKSVSTAEAEIETAYFQGRISRQEYRDGIAALYGVKQYLVDVCRPCRRQLTQTEEANHVEVYS